MSLIVSLVNVLYDILDKIKTIDFTAPLLLRIFLAPIFIKSGFHKLQLGNTDVGFFEQFLANSGTVSWFGNSLGLPAPDLLAFMAGWTEFLGGWLLVFGLLTRVIVIPLMATMIVAAATAHWDYGWHTFHDKTLTVPWEWRADMIDEGQKRKRKAVSILKENSNYKWLTEYGSVTILKNGIELSATYFIMLLALFFIGGGRYASADYWLKQRFRS